jgi:hypothetical protein
MANADVASFSVVANVNGTSTTAPCAGAVVADVDHKNVPVVTTAFAGTAENPAIANADAATSAMRLKLVFVDIIFLSRKVDSGNFPLSAWPEIAFS